jgi:hypothetical protein
VEEFRGNILLIADLLSELLSKTISFVAERISALFIKLTTFSNIVCFSSLVAFGLFSNPYLNNLVITGAPEIFSLIIAKLS